MNNEKQPLAPCPVLTLPVEITSEIFLHCVSPASIPPEPTSPLDNPPIILTKICRDWRLIALSMPQLWSDIRLEFGGKHGLRTGHIDSWWVSFLETWFPRAQEQPLTMAISNMNHFGPDQGLTDLLDRHRERWRDLTLGLPFSLFYRLTADESLPILERLVVDAHSIPHIVDAPIAAFQPAPMLNHVSLCGYLRPSHFIFPWHQLTSLELATARADDCLECLRWAPKLVTCCFGIQEGDASVGGVPPLLHLASLTVSGASPTAIFPYTTMPVLEQLRVVGQCLTRDELSHIPFFLSRSTCRLRRLRLHFVSKLLTSPAMELLEALPSLESLELAATEASTLATLFYSLYGESFLPQLQTLTISHHRMSDENMATMFETMADLLMRRDSSTSEHVRLQAFSLAIEHEQTAPTSWIMEELWELVDRGMDLTIGNRKARWIG
ncbi:hypothetical protein K438DRAFT_2008873 [Mycena galopus ATCC 62051]|nr:hypothetical protein K438DRAFT_2008873 [Mycena galopus ATCC 62051]